ncbi:MAG: indolepyruvate oxidoreductase subunit beta [Treponema sp.]|jgi:indolepyruvate ferredoxin oxidoreductase beta subunit|nr:indolepyruvate oxidoreductase subunit beta [Treponema sp.]
MKMDIILAGVGGQGVLSIAAMIAEAAHSEGLKVRQSEVHGMAQRGGAVLAHLRISDTAIASDLVPKGSADLIISMEPIESLRYLDWLSPKGALVTAAEPFINIPDYPNLDGIYASIRKIPNAHIVEAAGLAKEAGLARSVNVVIVGAASPFLPLKIETIETVIRKQCAAKEPSVTNANLKALALGRKAAEK